MKEQPVQIRATIERLARPRTVAYAHCDLPCGVYDPAQARIEAESVKAIQERYKDDKQRQQQEIMALYKAEKVNPLAGCLPMLVQMPPQNVAAMAQLLQAQPGQVAQELAQFNIQLPRVRPAVDDHFVDGRRLPAFDLEIV